MLLKDQKINICHIREAVITRSTKTGLNKTNLRLIGTIAFMYFENRDIVCYGISLISPIQRNPAPTRKRGIKIAVERLLSAIDGKIERKWGIYRGKNPKYTATHAINFTGFGFDCCGFKSMLSFDPAFMALYEKYDIKPINGDE